MEASDDSGMMEAGRSSQPEPKSQASHEEVKVRFSREEYDIYSNRQEMPLKGLSLMPIKDLDSVSVKWPDERKVRSKKLCFLRGLAVNYFYQSRMAEARELLLQVWDCIEDLDTALMLAECTFALADEDKNKGGETTATAVYRVCAYVKSCQRITSRLINEWNDQVKRSGRFMGYVILQFAWFRKVKEYEGIENARHLVYDVIKKINLHLLEVEEKLTTPGLALVFLCILEEMTDHLDEFNKTTSRKQPYVEALCHNALACLFIRYGNMQDGLDMARIGVEVMDAWYGAERTERILYGDLILNKGVAQYGLSQGRNNDHLESFNDAISVYQPATENITHSDRERLIELVKENVRKAVGCVVW